MINKPPVERLLNDDERDEMEALIIEGLEQLRIDRQATPESIVSAIRTLIDDQREQVFGDEEREGLSYTMGSLWGEQICRELGWEWVVLTYADTGDEGTAIVSSDRAFVYFPMHWIYELLTNPERENTLGLVFNMLRLKRDLPTSKAGEYRVPYR
jgi:hypothetical protein